MDSRWQVIRPILLGLVSGMVGILIVELCIHAYSDHQAFHAIINMINQNAAKQVPAK